jgi:3-isopropylmalate dehydrogenase
MMLRHAVGLDAEAGAIESAIEAALQGGHRTADRAVHARPIGTTEMAAAIAALVEAQGTPAVS